MSVNKLYVVVKKKATVIIKPCLVMTVFINITLLLSCNSFAVNSIDFFEYEELFQLKNSEELIGIEEVIDRNAEINIQPRVMEKKYSKQQYEKSIEKSKRKIMINNDPAQFAEP